MVKNKKHKYAAAFIIIAAAGWLLTNRQNWIMPVNTVVLTLLFSKGVKDYCRTFYQCLTVTFLLFCGILLISSPIMLIAPGWHGSEGFNILVGGVLLTASIAVKIKENIMDWFRQVRHEGYVIALELVLLLFMSFVLPMYFPYIAAENVRRWSIFILSFMCVLAVVGLLLNRMKDIEYKRRELAILVEHQEAYKQQVLCQFEKVVTLKHYYDRLYQGLSPYIR